MTAVVGSVRQWQQLRDNQVRDGLTLGFVPTMGALHRGHAALIRRSKAENDRTLVSIFVNPTQFDDSIDFARYPRIPEEDLRLLRDEGVDFLLTPTEADVYPDRYRFRVIECEESRTMEGEHRPGHFDGVLTVVLKLLQLAAAEHAYFGEKDWQQLTLVRGLVDAFFLRTRIVACPTVREPDGLALSSRNRGLSSAERTRAPQLFRFLAESASAADARCRLEAAGFGVDYVQDHGGRRCGAVRVGGIRLIDNVPVGLP